MLSKRSITLESKEEKKDKEATEIIFDEKKLSFGRSLKSRSNSMNGDRNIEISDVSISRNHCSIISYDDKYYLVDEGSSNGTYIIVPGKNSLILKDKMVLKVGATKFSLNFKSFNEIELEYTNLDGDNIVSHTVEVNIKRGNTVGVGFSKSDSRTDDFIGFNDTELSTKYKDHIIFKRNEDFLVIAQCNGWVKVKLVPQRLYRLKRGTQLHVCDIRYDVTQVNESAKDRCLNCKKGANLICLPCEHHIFCSLCYDMNNYKSCLKCNKNIKDVLMIEKLKFI